MRGLFVTATDTEVGKTMVCAALARLLRERGVRVGVMKPVASGARETAQGLVSDDTSLLMAAAPGCPAGLVTPFAYAQPVSPSVAARESGRPVKLETIQATFRALSARHQVMLVEGVGGVMVPLGAHGAFDNASWGDLLVSDMIQQLGLPVLVLARDALGAINHTLLTLDHLRRKEIEVHGVLLNQNQQGVGEGCANADEIARVGRVKVCGSLPWQASMPTDTVPDAWRGILQPLVDAMFSARSTG